MKHLIIFLFITTGSWLTAQINIRVSGNIFNSPAKSAVIAKVDGNKVNELLSSKMDKDGNFDITGSVPQMDYYVLLIGDEKIHLILRDKCDIKVYGDGANLANFLNIVDSEESSSMHKYYQLLEAWQYSSDSAAAVIKADPSKADETNREMNFKFQRFQGLTKSFIARNPNSPALYAAIGAIDPNSDFPTYEAIVNQLIRVFSQSPEIQQLQKTYEAQKAQIAANDILAPGKYAPDFEEEKPDGSTMKLSDLKGQVVLLDFWASWCGPCRRENPNVVALYEKYKDKGFTVMSVSLDKDRTRWLEAIEKDHLSWPNHVSDLKYWSSKAAKLYGVSGIPFTVLIDQEGKIIGTKLRGAELAEELARILGS